MKNTELFNFQISVPKIPVGTLVVLIYWIKVVGNKLERRN